MPADELSGKLRRQYSDGGASALTENSRKFCRTAHPPDHTLDSCCNSGQFSGPLPDPDPHPTLATQPFGSNRSHGRFAGWSTRDDRSFLHPGADQDRAPQQVEPAGCDALCPIPTAVSATNRPRRAGECAGIKINTAAPNGRRLFLTVTKVTDWFAHPKHTVVRSRIYCYSQVS